MPSDPALASAIARAKQEMSITRKKSITIKEGNATVSLSESNDNFSPATQESLGTKIIEGIECEGTRTSTTIPAGQIGNERPITLTSERWYSPKLQVDVLVKRNDPRSGENRYRLVNIDQSEPSATLFQVPADYSVIDMAEKTKMFIKEVGFKPQIAVSKC
jgi:hypothetical protein